MVRGKRLTRVLAAMALGAGLLVMPTASAQQVPDPDFPNLPQRQNPAAFSGISTFLTASYAANQSFIGPAKQWVQLTDLKVAADVAIMSTTQLAACERVFGAGSPRCRIEEPGAVNKNAVRGLAYPVDFRGDDPASPPADRAELRRFGSRFTDFPIQRLRTVAFGSIPVEATIHLSLATDESGLPLAIQLDADNFLFGSGANQSVTDSIGSGSLELRLSDLVVDGVPTAVGDACRLERPAALTLRGRGYLGNLFNVPPGGYNPNFGGVLQGALAVGTFAGCGDGREDLSPLVNAMAGESEVPVRVLQAQITGQCFNSRAGAAVSEARCNRPAEEPFPEGEELPFFPPTEFPPPPVD